MDLAQYRLSREFSVIYGIVGQLARIKACTKALECEVIDYGRYTKNLPPEVSSRLLNRLAEQQDRRTGMIRELREIEAGLTDELRRASRSLGRVVQALQET